MRTTIDINYEILNEVRKLKATEGRSLGSIVSELLAVALARRCRPHRLPQLQWTSKPMIALVDIADKEELEVRLERGDS